MEKKYMLNEKLNIETLKEISTLCRYLCADCFEFSYAERRGFVIPDAVQKEKLQNIKNFGAKITKLLEEL